MRYPGENAAGRRPGRRHSPSGRTSPPEEAGCGRPTASPRAATHRSSRPATPAAGRPGTRTPSWPAADGTGRAAPRARARSGASRPRQASRRRSIRRASSPPGTGRRARATTATTRTRAIPGWPWTMPDQPGTTTRSPAPVIRATATPGPSRLALGSARPPTPAYRAPDLAEPGYAALAVSEPAADVTSTQAWETVDSAPPASHWPDPDTTAERWPGASEGQHTRLPGATLAAGLGGAGPGQPGRPGQPGTGRDWTAQS